MKRSVHFLIGKSLCVMSVVAMLAAFSGCGASSGSNMKSDQAAAVTSAEAADFGYGYADSNGAAMDSYDMEEAVMESPVAAESGEGASGKTQTADTGRKLIKNVNMSVETREFESLISMVEEKAGELGGYIQDSSIYNGSSYGTYHGTRYASLTIRVPQEKLDGFIHDVEGISNVVRCSQNVEDVTLTYVDLESHKKALETEQERLLQILEAAETVEDIITVESRLSQVRYELESMASQLRTYDNLVAYSTVYMEIEEVEELTPVVVETTGQRIVRGFTNSIKSIGRDIREFFVSLIIHLPYLVVWGIIIAAVVFVVIRLRRKKKGKRAGEKEKE